MSPHKKQNPFGREHSRSMRRQKSECRQVAQNAARQQHAHGPPKQRPFPSAHRAVPRADISHGVHRAPNGTGKQQSKQNRVCPQRARKIQRFLAQPIHVAEKFTNIPGVYVPLKDTLRSFQAIINGDMDAYPEMAFFNVGTIEDVVKKAEALGGDS